MRRTSNAEVLLRGKRIFYSALDWGLGHATRSVPLIRQLLDNDNRVILGVTPLTETIFQQEFPELERVSVPAYAIRYPRSGPLWLGLLIDWPRIRKVMRQEHLLLNQLIPDRGIDVVISDSRFGLWSEQAHCIFVTHQLFVKAPLAGRLAQRINKKLIRRFQEVWVPDYKDRERSLSGDLSHGRVYHPNVTYVGPQSRLHRCESSTTRYNYLFLISGPEQQRTLFAEQLLEKAGHRNDLRFCVVGWKPLATSNHIACFPSPDAALLASLLCSSDRVISRSGYSTLMDLHQLGIKGVILVPTPGQTEQEYLADYWRENYGAICIPQNALLDLGL